MDFSNNSHYMIAALVLSNLGMLGSLIIVAFKVTWWISKLESRVDGANAMAVRAHKRLDKIED